MAENTGSKRAAKKRKGSPTPSTSLPSLDGPGKQLARDISYVRRSCRLSRNYVAAQLKLPVRCLIEWERGTTAPTPIMLGKLADTYEVPVERFVPVDPKQEGAS